jgi:C4-dicarboxylate-specific signal transduction histidine kinase
MPDMQSGATDGTRDRFSQAMLDGLPDAVLVVDRRGRIVAANRAWRRLVAESGESCGLGAGVGQDYAAAFRAAFGVTEGAPAVFEGVTAVLERSAPSFSCEYLSRAPDLERWILVSANPLGGPLGDALVVHVDISARKQAEDQARRALACAAQASRVSAVGILAASLVHELTQPLSAAAFYSGTAVALLNSNRMAPDRLEAALSGVDTQIQRATEIVQRLRGFLRQREMHLESVPIDEVVFGATRLVQWFAADRNVRLHFVPSEPSPLVLADVIQLEQVLINLVCNSIQAIDGADMPQREVSINLQAGSAEVEVTIRDTGPGVSPGDQERLFDIFASTRDAGLGMGLSISREIVEAHGGRLWADESATEGACFHFTVPLQAAGPERNA